jgi:hypothetical protein
LGPRQETEEEMLERSKQISELLIVAAMKLKEATMDAVLRLKMSVSSVKKVCDSEGVITQEEISLMAVYSNKEGSANAQWSKWTPSASLVICISNPQAFGKVLPGQFVFVDLTPTDKDAI